jgi:hypothetical protein
MLDATSSDGYSGTKGTLSIGGSDAWWGPKGEEDIASNILSEELGDAFERSDNWFS